MELIKLIEDRYSVRSYSSRPVEKEKIEYILECARLAPSACNLQPWAFFVIEDNEMKAAVERTYNREWFKDAPIYVIVVKDVSKSWKRLSDGKDSGDIDAAIAAQHICLAAHDIGLGTCWVCNFDKVVLSKILGCTESEEPIAIFPLGYIKDLDNKVSEKKRKTLDEIVTWL